MVDGPAGHERVFHALADPTRRRVLELLGEAGEATAGELARPLPITRQAVVQHLGVLEDAQLATSRRHGRRVLYRVLPRAIDETARWMASIATEWDRRLEAIRLIAEDAEAATAVQEPDPSREEKTNDDR